MGKPPAWNELRANARQFAARWADETHEQGEAQTFWNEFLQVFGIDRRRVATFEMRAQRESTGGRGRIDLWWPKVLIAEHKSTGKSLEDAEQQALDYLAALDADDFPGVVITSDFARIRIRDLGGDNTPFEFNLSDLPTQIDRFGFIAGYRVRTFGDEHQEAANITAAKLMGRLYEELSRGGYEGHDASILLTRLLFLMFGDDTAMWEKGLFAEFLDTRTQVDGSDLGGQLAFLFQLLDTPEEKRAEATDELLRRFPYVNGRLFSDRIDIPVFDRAMRDELVRCSDFDWSRISPAVFGSLFQAVKSREARRVLGEHYTTEQNILRALDPLFLDDLHAEFEAAKHSQKRLTALHDRIADVRVLDPACGCGNFLVIAFRELRRLELEILKRLAELRGDDRLVLDVTELVRVRIDHFSGIEIEEWPAQIAGTAMFLVDQQANHDLARAFGQAPDRLPIMTAANIRVGNALRTDWNEVVSATDVSFIVGNPPFVGMSLMNDEQRQDNRVAFETVGGSRTGRLDYVACWYAKTVDYLKEKAGRAAFVSTNSLTQGEQARTLGPLLSAHGFQIDFAHRGFKWSSEAPNAAQVRVVIVGMSWHGQASTKRLFDHPDATHPIERTASHINFYLADAPDTYPSKRTQPLVPGIPAARKGCQPTDGGGLLVSDEEYASVAADARASKYLRRLIGAHDMLHDERRWCLWLKGADPDDVARSPELQSRLKRVRDTRLASPTESVRRFAEQPGLFTQDRQPAGPWLSLPAHSSEGRRIIPMMFFGPDDIAHNSVVSIEGADDYLFGVLQSAMFTAWVSAVGGKLGASLRLTPDLCYCTFPFPESNPTSRRAVEVAGLAVRAVREKYPKSSLATLYDPLAMPADLSAAHDKLDLAVDAEYTKGRLRGDSDRLQLLFERYAILNADLLTEAKPKKGRKKA